MGWQVPLQGNGGSQTHLGGPAPFRYCYLVGVWIWMSDSTTLLWASWDYYENEWKRGRWEGGLGWGIYVNPWLIHVNVWQKPLQYCKGISLQLIKINEEKKMNEVTHRTAPAHCQAQRRQLTHESWSGWSTPEYPEWSVPFMLHWVDPKVCSGFFWQHLMEKPKHTFGPTQYYVITFFALPHSSEFYLSLLVNWFQRLTFIFLWLFPQGLIKLLLNRTEVLNNLRGSVPNIHEYHILPT